MAKFRFPGKALKLNTRKRVRFRGSYPVSTPEELYTRKIRRGLALFGQLFGGDSDEDEEEFEGFADITPSHGKGSVPAVKVVENKVEQVCSNLEKEGLVRRTRMSAVTLAVKEVKEGKEKALLTLDERTKVKRENSKINSASDVGGPECSTTLPSIVPDCRKKVTIVAKNKHRQTRCRISRQPTVKTALAKKLLAKAKKKLPSLPVVGEKSPKRFILPAMSARSSRIIKPNKRLFADIMEMCSTSSSLEFQGNVDGADSKNSISGISNKRIVKFSRRNRHSRLLTLPRSKDEDEEDTDSVLGPQGVGRDRMKKTISLYTESITGTTRGQVGRPPKRLLRRLEGSQHELEADIATSPQKCDAKESRVKEKIEKLLRSPWDDRLKQSGKVGKCDIEDLMPAPASSTSPALSASAISRNILRKARLNLNKSTLQKIRNPASLQRLIPQSDEGKVEGRCFICDRDEGENTRKFGVVICEVCCSFIRSASDGPKDVYECVDASGGCRVQGLVEKDRCLACWLGRILQSCTMPNLLHDRLRKRLPSVLKEKIPTSLARCMNIGTSCTTGDKDAELASHTKRLPLDPGGPGGGAFGNVMDLPGGWRRKTGSEVIVISPSGEKFKSMHKLEEFLKNQGICADARVLFGNNSPVVETANEAKPRPAALAKNSEHGRVVVTTLPGGWTRRIKWRSTGGRFDTYVYSPDGRTFRSKRELSAYFQQIGKVDDIHKYFPVVNGNSDSSTPSSSDTTGSSSTEPVSSSEVGSDISSDDKSPEVSEVEIETSASVVKKTKADAVRNETDLLIPERKEKPSGKALESVIDSSKSEALDQDGNENPSAKQSRRSSRIKTHIGKGHRKTQSLGKGLESAGCSKETFNIPHPKEIAASDIHPKETIENQKVERKQRKSKMLRTRSLSIGSRQKGDTSLTDTTESESEQRHSIESTLFSRSFLRNKDENIDKSEEVISTEKSELCSAWNLDLYESAGESLFKSDDNRPSEDRKLSLKSAKKRKKLREDLNQSSASTIVPDVKGSSEKATLIIKRNVLESGEEPSKDKILSDSGGTSPLNREALCGISLKGNTGKNSPSHLHIETQSSDSSQKKLSANVKENITISLSRSTPTVDKVLGAENITATIHEPVLVVSGQLASKKKPKLKRKLSSFQSFHFGNNWSRKVKWNEMGEGKVVLLHSPDGQKFRSRIELQAYFKKAGKPKVDLDYYFPPVLKREVSPPPVPEPDLLHEFEDDTPVQTIITEESEHSSEASDFIESEFGLKTSEDSCASTEGFNRRNNNVLNRLLETLPDGSRNVSRLEAVPKRIVSKSGYGKRVIFVSSKSIKMPVNNSESEEAEVGINEAGGPRVKHVCRSKAQVLGISRAVFPSPEKERKMKRRTREVVTVTEKAASGKILRKTVWCNKCSGCNTPNCQKCANCLDMKKYGGKGTKKKPCIKRKCLNPRLSAKSAAQSAITVEGKKKVSQTLPNIEPFETREISRSPTIPREITVPKPDVIDDDPPLEVKISPQDKSSVFVPRQMTRIQPDQKDRGDITAGKKFVPGALVNIDYWQGYDVDEMMLSGFAVTTASVLYPQTLCFRCGSAGKERLLYCICCCEGVHPFCMEDGEGPESDTEELFWICRRCAVCHVCGAPGADSLLRCSDCRNYYHMECLGPSAHSTCQPSPDRPWEADMWAHLRESWPHQSGLYDVSQCEEKSLREDVVVYLELDPLKEADEESCDGELEEPDIFFLHVNDPDINTSEKSEYEDGIDLQDFDLDDTICLEDRLIELFRDVDLQKPQCSATSNIYGEEVLTLNDDEYLCLGYKKLHEYASRKIEISYYRLLQIIHNELFDTLGYPRWRELVKKGLAQVRSSGCSLDSETDTASEGASDSDDSEWDWEDVLEIRRFEALQEMKEREERKMEEERRELERERESNRLARLKELEREGKDPKPKNGIIIRKKKKRGRPPGSVSKAREGLLDFIVADDHVEECSEDEKVTPKRARFKQPRSWEEFDKLFAWKAENSDDLNITEETEGRELEEREKKKKEGINKTKAKVVYSCKVKLNKKCNLKQKSKETVKNRYNIGCRKFKSLKKYKKEKFTKQQRQILKKKVFKPQKEKVSSRKEIEYEPTMDKSKKKAGKSPLSKKSTKDIVIRLDRITKDAKPLSGNNFIDAYDDLRCNRAQKKTKKLGKIPRNKCGKGDSNKVGNVIMKVKDKLEEEEIQRNSQDESSKKKKAYVDGPSKQDYFVYSKESKMKNKTREGIYIDGIEAKSSEQDMPFKDFVSSCDNLGGSVLIEDLKYGKENLKNRVSGKRCFEPSESCSKQSDLLFTNNDNRDAKEVSKSEEENSDKENRFNLIPEKMLSSMEKGLAASLTNGLGECSGGDSGASDELCVNIEVENNFEHERTGDAIRSDGKRTLDAVYNEADLGSSSPQTKQCKVEETSRAQSPVASKSFQSVGLTLGRRRRSEGRASLLASQRKAMMDY